MFSRLRFLALLVFLTDLVLLGAMLYYTSWLVVLAFVFISALIGVWVLNNGLSRYVRKTGKSINTKPLSAELFLLGTIARSAAGVLLIVPGVLTDILALLLLSPVGTWFTRFFFSSLFMAKMRFPMNEECIIRTPGNKPASDEIIDIHFTDSESEQ